MAGRHSLAQSSKIRAIWQAGAANRLLKNAVSLYAVQGSRYLVALALVPFLARTLGPAGLGQVVFAQGFGTLLFLAVDWGFSLSATREMARLRSDRASSGEFAAGVWGAKCLIALASGAVAFGAAQFLPPFNQKTPLLIAAIAWGVAQGFLPWWYFQGIERLHEMAGLDLLSRALSLSLILVFVRTVNDAWQVLAWQACFWLLAGLVGFTIMRARLGFRTLRPTATLRALRVGSTMALNPVAWGLWGIGPLLLGFFFPLQAVGYYGGAEKIAGAVVALFEPLTKSLFPGLSALAASRPADAARLARIWVVRLGAAGLLIGTALFIAAPFLVPLLLGNGFGPAVPILQLMSLLPLLVAVSSMLGMNSMVPRGLDLQYSLVASGAALVNVVLVLALGGALAGMGVTLATIGAILAEIILLWFLLVRHERRTLWTSSSGK